MAAEMKDIIVAGHGDGKIEKEEINYGFWQLCPKCDGEGKLNDEHWEGVTLTIGRTCPVCNGSKILARPEIKNDGL